METKVIVAELRAIRAEIAELREDIDHYRGFVGGVVWCLSAVAGAVGFMWGVLKGGAQ